MRVGHLVAWFLGRRAIGSLSHRSTSCIADSMLAAVCVCGNFILIGLVSWTGAWGLAGGLAWVKIFCRRILIVSLPPVVRIIQWSS